MGATYDNPWYCASGDCRGERDDCSAKRQNHAEALWLSGARAEQEAGIGRFDPFVLATLRECGLPEPQATPKAAREALRDAQFYRED